MNEFGVVGLYDHNADSYKKVREAFETSDVVGIVHATGTGKSYNALQLAYDNKDKKIIYVVPSVSIVEHIRKIIDDNPNLDMERDFPNLEFRTYQSFINMDTDEISELDIDLLILDEFHHIGAPVWGSRIDTVIDTHPDMKIFGMTAYTVRDRGTSYERDMALDEGDELFSDNIVSGYDLCDAMIDGVLPKPIYRSSYIKLIDMASELEQRVQRLAASGRDCSEYIKILSDVKKRIHEAPSMGEIVKKNIKKNGKYIYFCPPAKEDGVNDIETIKKQAMSWFKEIAPEEDIVIYTSLSEMKDGGKSQREAFYDDLDLDGNNVNGKLRVMFAINQYNEGVHAPNIDGVIMGRGTCSDIVFFEQLGRALSVSSGVKEKIELYSTYSIERLRLMRSQNNISFNNNMSKNDLIEKLVAPVIIDLAGNIDFIRELEDNLKDRLKELKEKGNGTLIRGILSDASFDLDVYEVNLFNILKDLKDKTDMTWDDWYKLAEEYFKEHGDLEVSQGYVTSNGEKLGVWLSGQRTAYRYRNLSSEDRKNRIVPLNDNQVKLLESIGMVWNVFGSNWNKMYEVAKKYFQKYENLNVPANYETENGENLGSWIRNQRRAYKNRCLSKDNRKSTYVPLTDEQVSMLESIGMIWDVSSTNWNKMYKLATEYFHENGDLYVPKGYLTSNGENLGQWIQIQRLAYKNRYLVKDSRKNNYVPLTDEQISMLESIGMVWNVLDSRWGEMYKLAQEYFEKNGDLNIPKTFISENGENLGSWIRNQRVAYRNRFLSKNEIKSGQVVLTDDRVKKLEKIGMVWDVLGSKWDKMYKLAQEYYEMYENLNIPGFYVSPNGERLGLWIGTQRQAYKNHVLTGEQISMLESIGMIWNVSDTNWNRMYKLAQEYFNEYGNLEVSQKFITKNGEKLGSWIGTQRQAYKKHILTEHQIIMLESIGMVWDALSSKWDRMYKLAQEYFEKNGNLKVPAKYTTSDGEKLGSWVRTQRLAYMMRGFNGEKTEHQFSPLTDEQVAMLESIGMIWDIKSNKSDIDDICKKNGIDGVKNRNIISHISFAEFKVKLSYLKDNNIDIVDSNGLLHEIFSMSSMNMKLKYGVSLEDLVNMYGKEKSK